VGQSHRWDQRGHGGLAAHSGRSAICDTSRQRTAWTVSALDVERALEEVGQIFGIHRQQGQNTFLWAGYEFRIVDVNGNPFNLFDTHVQTSVYLNWERAADDVAVVQQYLDHMGNRIPAFIRQAIWAVLMVREQLHDPNDPPN
jgi:hypothetical protein